MSSQTVPIHFVRGMMSAARRRGLDVGPVLRAAGIPADIADQPLARVTVEQVAKATRAVWRLTDDELFGLGPPIPRGTFRFVGLAIIHAPDLREVVVRLEHATRVLPGVPTVRATVRAPICELELDMSQLDDQEHLATEILVALIHRFAGWLAGRRIVLRSIDFPFARPDYADDYLVMYGRMPAFDAGRVALTFDSALLDAPIIRNETEALAFIRSLPGNFYGTRDYGSTTAEQVRKILERGLRGDWPSADEVAAKLSVSPQHLRRLLHEEKTSISQIREEILRDAAIDSLAAGAESVDDLAVRLGFSEASAFRRAFRRWTGSPPGAYRP